MEYLYPESVPAMKSELDIFSVPPTQTAIESSYETDYRPTASLENGQTYELDIPASQDFTDLSATMVHIQFNVLDVNGKIVSASDAVKLVSNFANALFEQIDLYLGTINTSLANNMYHYQAYLEDLLYRHPSNIEAGAIKNETFVPANKTFELYFRLHLPMCTQDKLLVSGIPMQFKFTKSNGHFPFIAAVGSSYSIKITNFSLYIKRIKLFPNAQESILSMLERKPAKYFITRSDTKSFSITKGVTAMTIENVFVGQLPKRAIIGFVDEKSFSGDITLNPWKFLDCNISYIALNIDGVQFPNIPYTPNFDIGNCMREYVSLFRVLSQDEGVPQIELTYEQFKESNVLFAFDIGGELGAETGVLSLTKRGKVRLEVRFKGNLDKNIKVIVFGQYDNLITIDKDRQVTIDY